MKRRPPTQKFPGFTLIEVLVVLLIMGLFVGLVSAVVRPDERGLLRIEAERLAQLLDLAVAESHLTGKSIAWTADGPAYRFWHTAEAADGTAQWSEILDNDLLRARRLPQGMMITELQIETLPARGPMRLEFPAYGTTMSFVVAVSLGTASYAVAMSPMGEVRVLPGQGN
ncbi:MAG: prepilin-type N-terminal cleavage/methylation domain-containing protein [Rhodocyclaceae bacterium]|nr:prepilin-type N-terminal cleavage/methylation domain-containing protein [Rhodocyclaceae bacterium]